MTIVYCSWATGDDGTGDGSPGNPYKSIDVASTGLTGGDEVRVEKSPAHTALTGTLTFENGSTTVMGSGTTFLSELLPGDLILGDDGLWHLVASVNDDTDLALQFGYVGATAAGVSSQKLGTTDVPFETTQMVMASGTDANTMLLISGGWDLSGTPAQTGQTWFRETANGGGGMGLYVDSQSWVAVERLHFARFYTGIRIGNSTGCTLTAPVCSGNGEGIRIGNSTGCTLTAPVCSGNGEGIYLDTCSGCTLTAPVCSGSGNNGLTLYASNANTFTAPVCSGNAYAGISLYLSNANALTSPTCSGNGEYALFFQPVDGGQYYTCVDTVIRGTLTTDGNGSGSIYYGTAGTTTIAAADFGADAPPFGFPAYANARVAVNAVDGQAHIWTDGGEIVSQAATAGGTGREWALAVTSDTRAAFYPLRLRVAVIAVAANAEVTVSLYFKKSGTGIAGRLIVPGGQIAGVDNDVATTCPDDTNRNQVTVQFTPTAAGVVEVYAEAWYVSATDQTVIVDDISVAQA